MKNICFIDLETTGVHYTNSHPIELGACMYHGEYGKIIDTFHCFISPPKNSTMDEVAQKIHGVSLEQAIERGVTEDHAIYNFFNWAGHDYSFGGWNVQFDIAFFRRMCYDSGFDGEYGKIYYKHLDVQSVIRSLCDCGFYDREVKSLDDARKLFEIGRSEYHGALEDAVITAEVYSGLLATMWSRLLKRAGL